MCYTSDCFISLSSKSLLRRSYVPERRRFVFGGECIIGDLSNSVDLGEIGVAVDGDLRRLITSGVASLLRVGE